MFLEELYKHHGFKFYTNGLYNINLFGIRAFDKNVKEFDDLIGVAFKTEVGWKTYAFRATTHAGSPYLGDTKMGSKNGTAILAPSTYSGASQYKFIKGVHKGKYPALNQKEPFTLTRDSNMDGVLLSKSEIEKSLWVDSYTGLFGINIHRASEHRFAKEIGTWSAGCQVIQSPFDWAMLWAIIEKCTAEHGSTITYTLFDEEDLEVFGRDIEEVYNRLNKY